MKRSKINAILRDAAKFCEQQNFHLPPFAFWTPEQWQMAGHEYDEIRVCRMGWDITDFGLERFSKIGLVLFTIRNGGPGYAKPYCEKLLISRQNQICPYHLHRTKTEDIICRAGGYLLMQVYNANCAYGLEKSDVELSMDGCQISVTAGTILQLNPGESITLPPYVYHKFGVEPGSRPVLIGEVSTVNDDEHDNHFFKPVRRFSTLKEDEPPLYLLCNEYPSAR